MLAAQTGQTEICRKQSRLVGRLSAACAGVWLSRSEPLVLMCTPFNRGLWLIARSPISNRLPKATARLGVPLSHLPGSTGRFLGVSSDEKDCANNGAGGNSKHACDEGQVDT